VTDGLDSDFHAPGTNKGMQEARDTVVVKNGHAGVEAALATV